MRKFLPSLLAVLAVGQLFADPLLVAAKSIQSQNSLTVVTDRDRADVKALGIRLDKAIDAALAEKRIVGTVVVVSLNGKVAYRRAAGFADRENRIATTPDTIFRLASMSKLIVAAAALSLIQDGKLGLTDPVAKWLPRFKPKLMDGTSGNITIQELLTHTSGLDYRFSEAAGGPYHKANVSDGMDQPGLRMDDNLKRIASCPLLFAPGTKWRYSLSTDVLGAVIEKAAGKPLQTAVADLVTKPLRMESTTFVVSDAHRLAVPYRDGSPEPKKMSEPQEMKRKDVDAWFSPARVLNEKSYPSGGAGMAGTADDYVRFLEAIRTKNSALLNESMMEKLCTNQVGDLRIKESPGWGFTFGSGVLIAPNSYDPYSVGTIEWGGAYGNHYFMDPSRQLSVVALTNTTFEGLSGKFTRDIANAVYDRR